MAIAITGTADHGLSLGSATPTFTVDSGSGSNGIQWVSIMTGGGTGNKVTGVTLGGTAMTFIAFANSSNEDVQLWYLFAPPTGSNSLVITLTVAATTRASWSAYNGALQSTTDNLQNTTATKEGGGPLTKALLTVLDNSWMVMGASLADAPATSITGGVNRAEETENLIADSNAAITPAQSYTMGLNWTGGDDACLVLCAFGPYTAPPDVPYVPQVIIT